MVHQKKHTVKRSYSSPRREEQAQQTRQVIARAALELFTTQGFRETSVREIAERAVVSEQTVYNAFGDKVGLLSSAGTMYIDTEDDTETALREALRVESHPIERIRIVARDVRRFWEEGADAILQLETMILHPESRDPRLEDLADRALAHKLAGTRSICELLYRDGVLRTGVTLDEVATFLTAVDSASTVSTLLRLGWDMDQWEAWVFTLLTSFLDPTPAIVDQEH